MQNSLTKSYIVCQLVVNRHLIANRCISLSLSLFTTETISTAYSKNVTGYCVCKLCKYIAIESDYGRL